VAEFTDARFAVAVSNGSSALHIALLLSGVETGDEVICPALSFIATANAISYCNATPHFADSSYENLGLDAEKLASHLQEIAEIRNGKTYNKLTGKRIAAIVPMHTFGHSVDLDAILHICNTWKIPLVEDAAESLGSYYKGKHTGNHGLISCLSFNGNKTITTGGGGAIITNDEALGKLAKHITTTAKVPHKWAFVHDMVAYNYRMPNLNAALGCAQMETLPGLLEKKRKLADKYQSVFQDFVEADFFAQPKYSDSNYWLNTIILKPEFKDQRDKILDYTNENGVMTRPAWTLMTKLPMYKNCPKSDLSVALDLEQRMINIPSSPNLMD
jgi:perosamine synthetase